MWTILVAEMIGLFCTYNATRQIKTLKDTVVLCRVDTILITSINPAVISCEFSKKTGEQYKSSLKTLLLMDSIELVTPPDGVYELYITADPLIDSMPSRKGFVNVLDLYSRTAPDAKNNLEIDISGTIDRLFSMNQCQLSVYISIRFGPMKLADGSYSSKAGELRISDIRIVQTDN